MSFYRRNLPHYQPNFADYFITFRLVNSLPEIAIKRLNNERKSLETSGEEPNTIKRKIFARYEQLLDRSSTGPSWLSITKVCDIVSDSLHYRDGDLYDLYAYCLMPNHVHIVFNLLSQNFSQDEKYPVTKVLHGLKRYTAVRCNKIVGREGQFWQHESFDRVVRNKDELQTTIRYVLNNPVNAGFVDDWEHWTYTYIKPKFEKNFRSM